MKRERGERERTRENETERRREGGRDERMEKERSMEERERQRKIEGWIEGRRGDIVIGSTEENRMLSRSLVLCRRFLL